MYFKFMKRFENLCSIEEGPLNLSLISISCPNYYYYYYYYNYSWLLLLF